MGAMLSLGQDPRWRRFLVSRLPPGTAIVLDVATGTGAVARLASDKGRAKRVIGLDQSEPMLREAARRGSSDLVLAQAERLPFAPQTFDALTFTYLLRYVDDPAVTLRNLIATVKPGGVIASLEFAVPTNPAWRTLWRCHTRLVLPAAGRLASRAWYDVGRFLGPSIERYWKAHPLPDQLHMWREAGVSAPRWRRLSLGGAIVTWGVRDP
jgi:demethylmenaquinone methyltransferase/2-methoxy-6-polyprenyl-1,4-benzoquinol methylase